MSTGNDILNFVGVNHHVLRLMTNPYTGDVLNIDADYNLNVTSYDGEAGIDELAMTGLNDALFLRDYLDNQVVKHIELITAGDGDDLINLADNFYSLGNLTIYGGIGNDIIWSNIGNDWLYGQDGNDNLIGGHGNDLVDGGDGNDYLNGGRDTDLLLGGTGDDTLKFHADAVWDATYAVRFAGGPSFPESSA